LTAELSDDLPAIQQGASQLGGLAQPNGEGPALHRAIEALNEQVQELKSLATALKAKNDAGIASSESAFQNGVAVLNQRFDVLGLAECGSGPA